MSENTAVQVRAIEERDRARVNALFHESIHDVGRSAVGPLSFYQEVRWPLHTYVAVDGRGRIVGALHGQVLPAHFQMLSQRYGERAENYLRRRVRHITHLAVDHTCRGQGTGSRLMVTALDKMRVDGVRHVAGFLQNSDAQALRFYRRHGFEMTPEVPPFAPQYPAEFWIERQGEWFYQRLAPTSSV